MMNVTSRATESQQPNAAAATERGAVLATSKAVATENDAAVSDPPTVPFPTLGLAAAAASRRMSVMKPTARSEAAARKYSVAGAAAAPNRPLDSPEPSGSPSASLPRAPCFGATLSPAAQFSAFMCYEDLLEEKLSETYPDKSWAPPPRCLTPEKTIVLYIAPEDSAMVFAEPLNGARPQSALTEQGSPTIVDDPLPTSPAAATAAAAADGPVPLRAPPAPVPVKQLNVTKKFQFAMDMIDSMKKTRGLLPTSPRVVEKYLSDPDNPQQQQHQQAEDGDAHIKSYKTWNSLWTKEFKL